MSDQVHGADGSAPTTIPHTQHVAPTPEAAHSTENPTTSQGAPGKNDGGGHAEGGPGGVHPNSGEKAGLGAHKEEGSINPNAEKQNFTASIRKEHQV